MDIIEPPPSTASTPPWEVLVLVAPFLDPSTLAVASCVSKSWRVAASSPHLWLPLCLSRFPSSSLLLCTPSPSPRLLFSLLQSAASSPLRRRRPAPPLPCLSLRDLVFTIDVFLPRRAEPLLSGAKAGEEVERESRGVFRFDIEAAEAGVVERGDEMRVVWMAVRKEGWGSAFLVMERQGKGGRWGMRAFGSRRSFRRRGAAPRRRMPEGW
ncbi:hypothetical protein HPP92_011264 [Vanilla planifolia]|uniref:F-box protein n=1 Tax=Vanilla planifolia TaxID=51239 RepID=A0A835R078_VANPL|nr:hypothetical protein HPP92_011264 [Vanilla planifolia]